MGLLEMVALYVVDTQRAEEGGVDHVELLDTMDEDELPLEPMTVTKVCRATSIQAHLMVRLRVGFRTGGDEPIRLRGLIAPCLDEGADGVALGFLNGRAGIDPEVYNALVADGDFAWTSHRTVDNHPDFDDAWEDLAILPRLDQILIASLARGVEHGLNELLEWTRSSPGIARMIMAGGGLRPGHAPWLTRVGVWVFHVGSPACPGGGHKAYVDPDLVRTWWELIDEQTAAVRGSR